MSYKRPQPSPFYPHPRDIRFASIGPRYDYVSGLGQAANAPAPAVQLLTPLVLQTNAQIALAARPPATPPNPFRIMPAECVSMATPVQTATNVPAGATVVVAWPYILLSDAEAKTALDNILGTGNAGAGPAMIAGLAGFARGPVGETQAAMETRIAALSPTWASGGFMRDTEMDQSVSRGYLWLAFKMPTAQTGDYVRRLMAQVLLNSVADPATAAAKLNWRTKQGVPILAANDSDIALEDAARKSVLGLMQGLSVFAAILGAFSRIAPNAAAVTRSFTHPAGAVLLAAQMLQLAEGKIRQADATVDAVLALPAAAAAEGQTQLNALKTSLLADKGVVIRGLESAPQVLAWVAKEGDPSGGDIARRIRDTLYEDIKSTVASLISTQYPTIVREWRKCLHWERGQFQLDRDLRNVASIMQQAQAASTALLSHADEVMATVAAFDKAVSRVDWALAQLPLSMLERSHFGLPLYAWLGVGAVTLIGGAVVVRSLRNRRAAAPTKNRRRLR